MDETPRLDESVYTESSTHELAALARVVIRALGVLLAYWQQTGLPKTHPYCQAASIVQRYLQTRYQR